jgi:hypothetical protein
MPVVPVLVTEAIRLVVRLRPTRSPPEEPWQAEQWLEYTAAPLGGGGGGVPGSVVVVVLESATSERM